MEYSIITVKDKVSDSFIDLTVAQNPQVFIRNNLKFLLQNYPLRDIELYELGKMDMLTGICNYYPEKKLITWDSYKHPENLAENLAPLGADVQTVIDSFEKKVKKDKE